MKLSINFRMCTGQFAFYYPGRLSMGAATSSKIKFIRFWKLYFRSRDGLCVQAFVHLRFYCARRCFRVTNIYDAFHKIDWLYSQWRDRLFSVIAAQLFVTDSFFVTSLHPMMNRLLPCSFAFFRKKRACVKYELQNSALYDESSRFTVHIDLQPLHRFVFQIYFFIKQDQINNLYIKVPPIIQ